MKLSVLIIIIFTLLGKFTGFLREIIMTAQIGANIYTDIYYYSISATALLTSMVTTGIGAALIPVLSEAEIQGRMESFFNKLLTALIPILFLGVGILYLLSPVLLYLIAPGIPSEMRLLATNYSRILSINLFSISMQAMFMGYLQKNQRFFFPASLALPLNAAIIVGIFLSNPKNVFPLVIATAVGQFFCLLWLYIPMLRMEYRLKIKRNTHLLRDELGMQFMRMLPPTLVGTAAYQINTLIDRSLASLLPSGNTSYLNYADKLQGIVYSIMVVALLTVLFPTQSEYASKKEFKKLYSLTRENLSMMLLLVFPLAIGLMFLSQEITQIAYMRNQFTYTDAFITGNILLCYGGMVLFQSVAEMFSRTFFAIKETRKQMYAAFVSIAVNIVLNVIMIRPFGVYGLALATTLSTFVRMATLMWMSKDYYRKSGEIMVSPSTLKYFASSLIMLGALFGFRFLTKDTLGLYGYSLISVIIGATVYFIVLFLLRTNELIQLRDMAIGFAKRMRRNA